LNHTIYINLYFKHSGFFKLFVNYHCIAKYLAICNLLFNLIAK